MDKKIELRIIDDKQLNSLVDEILKKINESKITFYDAFGLLEIVKAELINTYLQRPFEKK